MTFLEFHQFIRRDLLIYSWIIKNFYLTSQKLEEGERLKINHNQVIIMEEGLLVQESISEKPIKYQVFSDQRIIYTTNGNVSLSALEPTTYYLIQTEDLFTKLDAQKLLPNFLLQVAEDFEKAIKWQRKLISVSPIERVKMILEKVIGQYQLDPVHNPEFPKWVKIYVLASFARCSVSTTSMIVNELANNGCINIKKSPWFLKQWIKTS
ncbi:TPA_asm: Crp/Fnr family transcriptional regulator [Listeria monocytogenes]|uniref:hypothetical protein n=1 Tax=Listeria monocytogenes TaxID=1639 RepID=UPI000A1D54AA|nr:hypothetical protein [Listeria monocytogenes]ARM71748.1 hypothetical protein LMxysn_0113 [Listeria monocytogenes]HAB0010319.1 Crp/Fnr family transcriptional regulator [Listeria monocytogenes]